MWLHYPIILHAPWCPAKGESDGTKDVMTLFCQRQCLATHWYYLGNMPWTSNCLKSMLVKMNKPVSPMLAQSEKFLTISTSCIGEFCKKLTAFFTQTLPYREPKLSFIESPHLPSLDKKSSRYPGFLWWVIHLLCVIISTSCVDIFHK